MNRKQFGIRGALAALAVTTMAMGAAPALAQPGPRGGGRPAVGAGADGEFGPFGERLARRLDLSDAQREAIAKIHEAGRARDLPLRKQLRQLRHELKGEMMKDAPSEKAVQSLVERIGEARTALQKGRLGDRLAVRAQLTAEQRDHLLAMGGDGPGSRGGRHGQRAGRGRPGPGGPGGPGCDGQGPHGRGHGPGQRWQQDAD